MATRPYLACSFAASLEENAGKGEGEIPIYSVNVFAPMGFAEKSNIEDFSYPCIRWGIDGNFDFNLAAAGEIFATTAHFGVIQILDPNIVPEYLLYALNLSRMEESFDRSFRASLTNMRQFVITIPVYKNGRFDVKAQKEIAAQFTGRVRRKSD
jgi:type I restriction enzyme M protein